MITKLTGLGPLGRATAVAAAAARNCRLFISEAQLQRPLHHSCRSRTADLPCRVVSNCRVGNIEVWMIERIEHLPPELHPYRLPDRELALHAQVNVETSGADENTAPCIAERELLLRHE